MILICLPNCFFLQCIHKIISQLLHPCPYQSWFQETEIHSSYWRRLNNKGVSVRMYSGLAIGQLLALAFSIHLLSWPWLAFFFTPSVCFSSSMVPSVEEFTQLISYLLISNILIEQLLIQVPMVPLAKARAVGISLLQASGCLFLLFIFFVWSL